MGERYTADSEGKRFFSIIGDEVTDKYANQEVLSVCLRFLDLNNDVSPNLDKTTGESIANAIL